MVANTTGGRQRLVKPEENIWLLMQRMPGMKVGLGTRNFIDKAFLFLGLADWSLQVSFKPRSEDEVDDIMQGWLWKKVGVKEKAVLSLYDWESVRRQFCLCMIESVGILSKAGSQGFREADVGRSGTSWWSATSCLIGTMFQLLMRVLKLKRYGAWFGWT